MKFIFMDVIEAHFSIIICALRFRRSSENVGVIAI